jgi:bla regulator protein blaR1
MSFELRLMIVSLSAFAAGGLAGAIAVPWLTTRLSAGSPALRARLLKRLRALPVLSAACAMTLALASFALFEPRSEGEATGRILVMLAGAAALLWTRAAIRSITLLRSTRRALRAWMRNARAVALPDVSIPAFAVDSRFPIVAVVGVLRPRLVIARSVLEACTPEEIRAILAHEQYHLDQRDNVTRAWFAASPDPLAWLPLARRMNAAWQEASEEAADDAAARLGATGRVALAQALIRVARLAPARHDLEDLPVSALYRGEALDRRIRRLLAPPSPQPADASSRRELLALLAVAIGCAMTLHLVHGFFEAAVTFLP